MLRLGTRGSKLALAQAYGVREQLIAHHPGLQIEIVTVKTSGDLGKRDGLGVFVREIQDALLERKVDLGLHCLKDLPTQQVAGLRFAAHLVREDPGDALISRGEHWSELPRGSLVGTGSVRRTAQLASHRPDLRFRPLIGNVDTRLRKLREREYDAIILATCGLKRLGLLEGWADSDYADFRVDPLPVEVMLPAPGQAVLVLETRANDEATAAVAVVLDHAASRQASVAERAFLRGFGGGCSVPVAALAVVAGEDLVLNGLVASPDGTRVIKGRNSGGAAFAERIGSALADELIAEGAGDLFESAPLGLGEAS